MPLLAVPVGALLILAALADVVYTLVSTTTNLSQKWLTHLLYSKGWSLIRILAQRVKNDSAREAILSIFAPLSLLILLTV